MVKRIVTVTMNPAIDKSVYVDKLMTGCLNRVKKIRVDPGGKGINVSKAFSSYGLKQIATGILGGSTGKQIMSMLKEFNFEKDFLQVKEETRVNIKINEITTGIVTEINDPGLALCSKDLEAFFIKLKKHLRKSEVLVLSGSLPQKIPDCFYNVCIQIAEKMNNKVILDTDGSALKTGIAAKPFAIKPNIKELEQLTGKILDTTDKVVTEVEKIAKTGVEMVLVSMGRRGSLLHYKGKSFFALPLDIKVKSTVGAGDAMVAALAYCILKDISPEDTVKITAAAGALTSALDGSDMAEWQEIRNYYNKVNMKEI